MKKLISKKNLKKVAILVGSGVALFLGAKYKVDVAPLLDLINHL